MGLPRRPVLAGRRGAAHATSRKRCWRGQALPGAGSLEVAETVLHPPVKSPLLRPGTDTLAFIATGLLPSQLRRGYGLTLDACSMLQRSRA